MKVCQIRMYQRYEKTFVCSKLDKQIVGCSRICFKIEILKELFQEFKFKNVIEYYEYS